MGLSIRSYAGHRGVSDTAVRKAIKSGRITLEADGTLDPAKADRQWTANTDPSLQREKPKARKSPHQATPAQSTAQPASARPGRPEPQEPLGLPGGGTSLLQAKTVNEVVKAQTNKVRLAKLKGELVERSQAIAHVFKLARSERDAWLNWPGRIAAQVAASLEVDAHTVHVVLENAVREHLQELGDLRPRVD